MIQVEVLDPQLQRIAQQVAHKHGNWRVEQDDMLQEARVGAWQALQRAETKGLCDRDARRYALGGARKECERAVARLKDDDGAWTDLLYHCETAGSLDDVDTLFYGAEE